MCRLPANGARLAVGAPKNDGNGNLAGHVRVFEFDGAFWNQLGADIDGDAAGDESGFSVELSADGSRLAVGAYGNAGGGTYSGQARVFEYTGAAWTQLGASIGGRAFLDLAGAVALSADGGRLAVGERGHDGNGNDSGDTRVFEYDGAAWTQLGSDIDGEAAGDESGGSVALSADGGRLAVGAHRNDGTGADSGHARVYDVC